MPRMKNKLEWKKDKYECINWVNLGSVVNSIKVNKKLCY